jgi:hypothetical protein
MGHTNDNNNNSALQQAVLCAEVATTYLATYLSVRLLYLCTVTWVLSNTRVKPSEVY